MDLHATTARQDPETGPPEPAILQCPRTASSGRRLTATTLGGWYGVRFDSGFFEVLLIPFLSKTYPCGEAQEPQPPERPLLDESTGSNAGAGGIGFQEPTST